MLLVFASLSCGGAQRRTIRIGFVSTCRGQVSRFYEESVAGAELPFIERGARPRGSLPSDGITGVSIAGKQVELVLGCTFAGSDLSNLAEMRRVVEQRGADVLVTPPALTAADDRLVRDYASQQPDVTFFGGDPRSPTSNMFRTEPEGSLVGAGLGAYAYRTLGWRTAVTFGEGDSFGWPIAAGFVAEFCSLGGVVADRYWTPFGTDAWAPKVKQIPSRVDGVALMAGFQGTRSFFSAYKQVHPDLARHVVMSAYPLAIGGTAPAGVVAAGYLPFTLRAQSWSRYLQEFGQAYPQYAKEAGGATDIFVYDAVEAALEAIDRVHGNLAAGERGFRVALGALRLQTPFGTTRFDADHRYVGPNFLMRMERDAAGKLAAKTVRVIPNVQSTIDGALTPNTTPTRTRPVCRKGHVPLWAR